MRIAFLGTPDFAVPSLNMLWESGHELMVFTQPDRPVGRKAVLTPPPVKAYALVRDIPVYQCEKIRLPEHHEVLKNFAPDLMVTAAFGQILSAENLSVPTHGCINVHGSLLPKYRGAAPIQWSVILGEKVTGITTMLTDVGLDTGDILLQREIIIKEDETSGELYERMAELGAQTLQETIAALQEGKLVRTKQDEALASHCSMLKKEDGKLDFTQTSQQIHDRVRGVNPWPGAYALLKGQPLKIWCTKKKEAALPADAVPGLCFGDAKSGLFVCTGDGALEILELQAPGAKRMEAKAYLRGKNLAGEILA